MKILKKNISHKDGSGSIMLRPETTEDLWHTYNLLCQDDLVRCTTIRKIMKESQTGSTTSSKKRLMLTIRVKKIDFDVDAEEIRLSGVVESEQKDGAVRMGAHHTLTMIPYQNFTLEKTCWDQIYLDLIDDACNPSKSAEVAAVVMHMGLAHVCLLTGSVTVTKAKITTNIPKKRTGSSNNSKAITKFFEAVYQAILTHIDFTKVKAVLIGSPGFVKDDFFTYLKEESVRRDDRPLMDHKSKFVLVKASNGHKYAIQDMLSDPSIMKRLEDTKVAKEVAILNSFMRMMDVDPDRAYYGYNHVKSAQEQLAIASLLVTDELFRSSSIATRKKYVTLVENVRSNGGTVYIFSSLHPSGQQLQLVSGVAALLRYPLPDLDELELQAEEYENENSDNEDNEDENGENKSCSSSSTYDNFDNFDQYDNTNNSNDNDNDSNAYDNESTDSNDCMEEDAATQRMIAKSQEDMEEMELIQMAKMMNDFGC